MDEQRRVSSGEGLSLNGVASYIINEIAGGESHYPRRH
jgi:hypothetical protein